MNHIGSTFLSVLILVGTGSWQNKVVPPVGPTRVVPGGGPGLRGCSAPRSVPSRRPAPFPGRTARGDGGRGSCRPEGQKMGELGELPATAPLGPDVHAGCLRHVGLSNFPQRPTAPPSPAPSGRGRPPTRRGPPRPEPCSVVAGPVRHSHGPDGGAGGGGEVKCTWATA